MKNINYKYQKMEEITNNWEICMFCGDTNNREGDNFCRECGEEIEYD